MKVKVDDQELFELTETQKKVICNDIPDEEFEADMKRRLHYILTHKYEQCFKRMKAEWEPKLKANGVKSIPLDDDEFAKLVLKQPNYKNRSVRNAEEERSLNGN